VEEQSVARIEHSGLKHRAERTCLAGGMGRQNQLAPLVARAPQDEQNQFHVRFAAEILQKPNVKPTKNPRKNPLIS
jgi:hypothetical protein